MIMICLVSSSHAIAVDVPEAPGLHGGFAMTGIISHVVAHLRTIRVLVLCGILIMVIGYAQQVKKHRDLVRLEMRLNAIRSCVLELDAVSHHDFYWVDIADLSKTRPITLLPHQYIGDNTVCIDAGNRAFTYVTFAGGHFGTFGYIYSEENLFEKYKAKGAEEVPEGIFPFSDFQETGITNWYRGINNLD